MTTNPNTLPIGQRAILIDPEKHSRAALKRLLSVNFPFVKILGEAESIPSACEKIDSLNHTLLFLNTRLRDGSAMELLDRYKNPDFKVIITTNSDSFSQKASIYNAVGYLYKPVRAFELHWVVMKLYRKPIGHLLPRKA